MLAQVLSSQRQSFLAACVGFVKDGFPTTLEVLD
jgi:hypothetical protein